MRLSWVLALAAVTALSGCEFLLDSIEPPIARQASGVDMTVAAPGAYTADGL
jgi:outer membrane lipopolysaccharide assembly protein LptE/RlpB